MPFRGKAEDPIRNFKFLVEVPTGGIRAGFSRVSGLKEQTEVVEYREGTDPARMRKLFGQTSFDNVTCERGITNETGLLQWRRMITDVTNAGGGFSPEGDGGDDVRREVVIALLEYHGRTTWEWNLELAWPCSLEIGEMAGDGNDVVVETVEFCHEGLTASVF